MYYHTQVVVSHSDTINSKVQVVKARLLFPGVNVDPYRYKEIKTKQFQKAIPIKLKQNMLM